jgi:GntR family transcriptional regulator
LSRRVAMIQEWRKERRPLAVQVRDHIWNMLNEEKYQPGDRLPSEMEMVGRFQVSRAALREGLKILEEERAIFCQHGVGRFVAPNLAGLLQEDITHLKSVSELARSMGMKFTCQVLSVKILTNSSELSRTLNLSASVPVMVLERVWRDSDSLLIYSIDHFSSEIIKNQSDDWSIFEGSLLALLEQNGQPRLEYSKTTMRAVHFTEDIARRIGCSNTNPWMMLEQINYDTHGKPLLFSKDYYSDKFQFYVLRRRR